MFVAVQCYRSYLNRFLSYFIVTSVELATVKAFSAPFFCKTRGLFLESPGNFSSPESCFAFACKIKVELRPAAHIQQKLIQVPPGGVCDLGTVFATIQQVLILIFAFGIETFPDSSRNEPQIPLCSVSLPILSYLVLN